MQDSAEALVSISLAYPSEWTWVNQVGVGFDHNAEEILQGASDASKYFSSVLRFTPANSTYVQSYITSFII